MVQVTGTTQVNDSTLIKNNTTPQAVPTVLVQPNPEAEKIAADNLKLGKEVISLGLIGGTATTLLNLAGKGLGNLPITGISGSAALYGAGLGTGVAMLRNAQESDSPLKETIMIAGGLGLTTASSYALIESAAKTVSSNTGMMKASPEGLILGATLGAGVGIAATDFGSREANDAGLVIGATMVGGSTLGTLNAMLRSAVSEQFLGATPTAIAIGAGALGGVALLAVETPYNDVKNVAAGTILGASAAAFAETASRIAVDGSMSAAVTTPGGLLAGAAIGTGIMVAKLDTKNDLGKNAVAGALIGGGSGAIVESIVRVAANGLEHAAISKLGIGIGIAAGVGLGVLLTQDKK